MSLPAGLDRADGVPRTIPGTQLTVTHGTATPDGAIMVQTPGGTNTAESIPLEEMPDSPQLERAEQATITHRYTMSYERAVNEIQFLGRGTVRVDSYGFYWKVVSATIEKISSVVAKMTVVEESISFDSPPDQFQIVPVELGINIIKHPRYFYAFLGPDGYNSATERLNQHVIRILQDYFENTTVAYRDAITALLKDSIGHGTDPVADKADPYPDRYTSEWKERSWTTLLRGTNEAKRAALEIVQKYWRGEETPYVVGYQITWSSFYFRPPYLNPGGYEEDPVDATPQLPAYFWANADDPSLIGGTPYSTIYDKITEWNPQCYSQTGAKGGALYISWLRKADEIDYERTWYKVTRTWIGSPVGFWDTDLYTSADRPTTAAEFQTMAPADTPT